MVWPQSAAALIEEQTRLAVAAPMPWTPGEEDVVGGCFVCFRRRPSGPGGAGDGAWAAAAADGETVVVEGAAGAPYEPGLLALREGALLERAVRALLLCLDVLLVNATGRDHPRRAGLALHLGAVLDLPTVGVTHRTLLAAGDEPADEDGAQSPLRLGGKIVGAWLRTRRGCRPLAVHAAWRTDPEAAVGVALAATRGVRTPLPLRRARQAARVARARRSRLTV
jgi:deoxyribonuclease V